MSKRTPKASGAERDRQVLEAMAQGQTSAQIAKRLGISAQRVRQIAARARKASTQGAAQASGGEQPASDLPVPVLGKRGEIDLDLIVRLRREGLDSPRDIARAMGLPPQVLLAQENETAVKEAIEVGRVLSKRDALRDYYLAMELGKGQLTGLAIFRMKQHGWTDRQVVDAPVEVNAGVRDRVAAACEALIAKWNAEGRSE